ncbi:diaminopimelate decarboxylase [Acidobacteriota bacterium]
MRWWENAFLKVKNNQLYLNDSRAVDIAEKYGTPLFIYSRKQVQENLNRLCSVFEGSDRSEIRNCYAMKANSHGGLLEYLSQQNVCIDAVSPGEIDLALSKGFTPGKIIFTGTSVSEEDLKRVFQHKEIVITIDAEELLDTMESIRDHYFPNTEFKVSVRWNPGIGRGFSPKTITAGVRSSDGTPIKFGIQEDRILPVYKKAADAGFIPIGLHQHLGSGWTGEDFPIVKQAVERMTKMAAAVQKAGFPLDFLDFGGGFGPIYYETQTPFPLEDYAECILDSMRRKDLNNLAVILEPGKFLVGDAGVLLLRVEYMKTNYGNLFACVNGGTFNTVPRPAIYTQAQHHIVHTTQVESEGTEKVTVAGNLCESGDVFSKEIPMPLPQKGDVLALLCAGAYCRTMASNFNLREIPDELMI